MVILLLLVGFILLIKGADLLVTGASALAKKIGVSDLVIGLTVVSFGTSTPELLVNIFASIQGNADIAIGNVIGSNIFNILLILGISSLIYPLTVSKGTVWKEIPFSLLAAVLLGALVNDVLFDQGSSSMIGRIDGFVLLAFFGIFMYYVACMPKDESDDQKIAVVSMSFLKSLVLVVLGLLGLVFGGKLVVDSAVAIATRFGLSQSLIGLTIVAAGTSLPELATSAVAAYRKNSDIAVGNIVGSNIFNIFFILGVSALIKPLPVLASVNIDMLVLIATSLLLFFFMFTGKRRTIDRWEGAIFLFLYAAYTAFLIKRG
jgi:cation:H+ antiporter